ncbi:MAG: amylo-alpha-1,6-glucosidase [Chloroflexi bacterium]|nr:amylo-alpha-1,6-glucosidase [Chloroflexota bacterium]
MATTRRSRGSRTAWRMLPEGEPRVIEDIRDALIIREGGLFLLTDTDGSIPLNNDSGFGLYHNDTRYLSGWDLSLIGVEPIVLLSTAEMGFGEEQVMTNPELVNEQGEILPSGSLEIRRQRVLDEMLMESVQLTNFALVPLALTLQYQFDADFVDLFELRGIRCEQRGQLLRPRLHPAAVTFAYRGRDNVVREVSLQFARKPDLLDRHRAIFHLNIEPGKAEEIGVAIAVDRPAGPGRGSTQQSMLSVGESHSRWKESSTHVLTGNEMFNAALDRSIADLRVLWTDRGPGLSYISAGVPWYDTLFGRDSALAAMMSLAVRPELARDVLRCLTRLQGKVVDPTREEEPGKIVHEVRRGEMANTGDVVFGRYYGSIDSTPLFVLLAAEYYRWTADLELMRELQSSIDASLVWMERFGDLDGDGYLEYIKKAPGGLDNQGWKDSVDGIVDEEGNLLEPPIALVEVQGYVYAAKQKIADVYENLGDPARAKQLREEAAALRRRINADFWMPEGYYALALDADKKPARVVTSNAGQLLWSGVPSRARARSQIERLMRNDMFSGWGVRTLSSSARRYNPNGYHLGTIWPHDNALIMAGLKRYGAEAELNEVATGISDAAFAFPYFRLPELFSGSPRSAHHEPVPYPVANRPQAFAAAALPSLLTSILGLVPDAPHGKLYVVRPRLPFWLDFVRLAGLRVGEGTVDLIYHRRGSRTVVEVIGKTSPVELVQTRRWPWR